MHSRVCKICAISIVAPLLPLSPVSSPYLFTELVSVRNRAYYADFIILRCVLGIGDWETDKAYCRSTLQGNVAQVKSETIQQISNLIVAVGHELVPEAVEKVRGDSFVVQTNIHYPTDANVLLDGVRKVLSLSAQVGELLEDQTWQYWRNTLRSVKKLYRKIQKVAANKTLDAEEKA